VSQEESAGLLAGPLGFAPPFYSQVPKNCPHLFTPKNNLSKGILLDIPTGKASWAVHNRKNIAQHMRVAISAWRPKTLRETLDRTYSMVNRKRETEFRRGKRRNTHNELS